MVKLKILLVTLLGVAGVASSYALADGGHHGDRNAATGTSGQCQRTFVHGTAAPQSLVVTVTKSGPQSSPFAPGQVITVAIGGAGDTVGIQAEGCANGSTLTARGAELRLRHQEQTGPVSTDGVTTNGRGHEHGHGHGHDHQTTTGATTTTGTTTDSTTTTTMNSTTTNSTTTDSTTTVTTSS